MGAKEQQRNLKKEIGSVAAAAVAKVEDTLNRLALEHRVLAAQMLEFEKELATTKAGRARDKAVIDSHAEQLENLRARLKACEEDIAAGGRREALLADNLRIEHARTVQFESMGLWRRLRWCIAGVRPPFYDPVNDKVSDASPQTAYPGDGV